MNFDVRSLASQKHHETKHAEVDWLKALESARQSLKFIEIDYQSLEYFALASKAPSQFTVIARLIYQYGKSYPHGVLISDLILGYVNDSLFSLSDWIEAIEYFYRWLEKQERKTDFLPMLKYLECCAASPDARESGQTLSALIQDMLQFIGYEG
jgi:hypothetical protein